MKNLYGLAICLVLHTPFLQGQVPKVVADLQPGTFKARLTLSGGPQPLALTLSSTIREEGGTWVVTDTSETPAGPTTDTATLEKGTLILLKRTIQGAATISFEIAGNKATGTISAASRQIPISVDIPTPLFATGPGAPQSIALLPLAEGYTTSYRSLDVGSQRVLLMQLRVVGSESVTVPAGTFETFKVECAADDASNKSTLWIAKDSRMPVKGQSVLHNGAIMTVELVP
jgi:hypothetical protein